MNIEEIFKKVSDPANPKFEIVIGSNNKADAKLLGSHRLYTFKGRWDDSPPYILF